MGYDESLFSRADDGWYSEKANTMATLTNEMDIYPGVQLPQRLNGGIYQIANNIKADWADISINNSTTANVQNNSIIIGTSETLDLSIVHQLVNFDNWYELRLIVTDNSSSLNFVFNNYSMPFAKVGNNEYLVSLTSFNSKTLNFSIGGNSGNITINNIIITSHLSKNGRGMTSLDISNVKNLSAFLNNLNEDLNTIKSDFVSKIQSDTKKFSELVNEDYIIGYNHISSITGKFVTINLGSGDWISLDGYDFSHSDNFSGVFNSSYVESGMTTTEIDSCFTFEVQKTIPQDLLGVKNELLSKIGDKITIETFGNGIRIKKDGTYIYSACWGTVAIYTSGTDGAASTTVSFPFTFSEIGTVVTNATTGTPLSCGSGNSNLTASNVLIYAQKSTTGTTAVRWFVVGK